MGERSRCESMAQVLLSEAERIYILHGVQDDLRCDGRGCEDYRVMELETDVVSNSSGSARVRLANTDVLVGVKAELGEPHPDRPNEGRLEGRGGEELANEISQMILRAYSHPECLNLGSLSVIANTQCWILYLDILVLECGGNLFDAVSIASKAALFNAKIPNVTVSSGEKGETELEISDDPYDCKRLDVSHVPCLITLSKIGHYHVVDASMQEEACTLARLVMGVTESGHIAALRKGGSGSLDPDSMTDMMESGKKVGQRLNQTLLGRLQEEEKLGHTREKTGFLR